MRNPRDIALLPSDSLSRQWPRSAPSRCQASFPVEHAWTKPEKNRLGRPGRITTFRVEAEQGAVRLISLDDVICEPWQYGISVAYALFRGFCDLGAAMTDTYTLFLNADFVLAEGCSERLLPHLRRGERVLLSPSYCVVEEEVEPLLARVRHAATGALVVPPRDLARIIIDHRHNTIRAKTISQHAAHFEYMDQADWQVDQDTIIGHQMPICMVAMRPERALSDIHTFWDWGIVYEFCPSRKLTVLGGSDEFLMLELRGEYAHLDLVRLRPTTTASALPERCSFWQVPEAEPSVDRLIKSMINFELHGLNGLRPR